MTRVFRSGEELLLEQVSFEDLRPGDVVAVLNAEKPYVHRILRITPAQAVMQGDNNSAPDTRVLLPEDDFYRVTGAVTLNGKKRNIANGPVGQMMFHQHRSRRFCRMLAGKILRKLGILPRY